MTADLVLTVVLAVGIGASLGLLGGGGSILAVPLLVYVTGLPAKEAIATSLFVVGVTSAVGVLPHARGDRVRWRTGLVFGLAGMTGAYAGGRLAEFIPGGVLLTGFALMMLATATAMIRGRRGLADRPVPHEPPVPRIIADGVVVGLVTGLVGAGGGFLVVPALALLGGLPMSVAVGTSLLVIAMKSVAGLAGYLSTVHIHWGLAVAVSTAAVAGSLIGGRLTGRVREDVLRRSFGWFVVVMGVFVLARQLPTRLWSSPLLWTAGAALVLAATAVLLALGYPDRGVVHRPTAAVPAREEAPTSSSSLRGAVSRRRYRRSRSTPRPTIIEGEPRPVTDTTAYPTRLDPAGLRDWLATDDTVRVLDVRSPAEFEAVHIPGAYNVPLHLVREHRQELRTHLDQVVLVCRSGMRATQAERLLAEVGMPNLHILDGGILAWQAAGAPVRRGRARWDIERQVRLVAGALVLLGVLTGVFLPGAQWFAAAVGAGLVVAALTNTCVMGAALAKLPFNRGTSCDIDKVVGELAAR